MDPQTLPLEPLIAPPAISWWPLAPIWWIGITLILISFISLSIYRFRNKVGHRQPTSPIIDIRRQAALKELEQLEKPYHTPAGLWLQQINALLKRLCITHYPTENSKVLTGEPWLNYLNSKYPEAHLKQFPMLVEKAYQADYCMENITIDNLYSSIKKWITHHV